jgi:hypothetical protein
VEDDKKKKMKQANKHSTPQGTWAHVFAKHLAKIVQPHPSENKPEEEEALTHFLDTHSNLNC